MLKSRDYYKIYANQFENIIENSQMPRKRNTVTETDNYKLETSIVLKSLRI